MSNMLRKVDECALCHSKEHSWRKVFSLNQDQDLVECRECGLFFNNFQRIDFENIYSDDYFAECENMDSYGGFSNYSALEHGIQKMYRFAHIFILSKSSPSKKYSLMEIGCSFGFFLKMFQKEKNFSLLGVELSKKAAYEVKKQGINVFTIPFEELEGTEKYDYITFFEVLEHTLSPVDVMKKVSYNLKPGGYAILSTPDIGSVCFSILKKRWSSIHPSAHNYYFNKSTMKKLAEKADLELVSIHSSQIMWSDSFHFRKRLSEMFPSLRRILKILSFMDPHVIPFLNGGDLRVILRKKG